MGARRTVGAALLAGLGACQTASSTGAVNAAGTCGLFRQLLALDQAGVEAMRGEVIRTTADSVTYASKIQLRESDQDCTISSYSGFQSAEVYASYSLHCFFDLQSAQAAARYVHDKLACTDSLFSERTITEARYGGRYRMIGFDGERTPQGRANPVDYGKTDWHSLRVETDPGSESVSVAVDFRFLKPGAERELEEIILVH